MSRTFTTEDLVEYLQEMMDDFMAEKEQFGMDKRTERKLDAMIACKEMVEAFAGEPVNLGKNGKVTVGW